MPYSHVTKAAYICQFLMVHNAIQNVISVVRYVNIPFNPSVSCVLCRHDTIRLSLGNDHVAFSGESTLSLAFCCHTFI